MAPAYRIHRHSRGDRFVVIPNDLAQNDALTWGARGLLGFLLSLPQDWCIRTDDLISRSPEGETRLRTLRAELEAAGHLRKRRVCDARGRVIEWIWEVTDEPHHWPDPDGPDGGNPQVENPHVDSPHVGNAPLYKETTSYKEPTYKEHTPPYPPEGGERGAPAEVDPSPRPEPVDTLALRHELPPWLDSRRRIDSGYLAFVARRMPKKATFDEQVEAARGFIRRADRTPERRADCLEFWDAYQAQLQQEREQAQLLEDMKHLRQPWQ